MYKSLLLSTTMYYNHNAPLMITVFHEILTYVIITAKRTLDYYISNSLTEYVYIIKTTIHEY